MVRKPDFSGHTGPDGLCHQMAKRQEASCKRKSVCHFNLATVLLDAQSWSQEGKCDRTSAGGYLPPIPQLITTSRAKLTTRELPVGSSKVVSSTSGGRVLRSCGYMANV